MSAAAAAHEDELLAVGGVEGEAEGPDAGTVHRGKFGPYRRNKTQSLNTFMVCPERCNR